MLTCTILYEGKGKLFSSKTYYAPTREEALKTLAREVNSKDPERDSAGANDWDSLTIRIS